MTRIIQTSDLDSRPRFVPVKELAALYGIKTGVVYEWIRAESSFPYVNAGAKKKFLVQLDLFEVWLRDRTMNQRKEHFAAPTTAELLALFKKGAK